MLKSLAFAGALLCAFVAAPACAQSLNDYWGQSGHVARMVVMRHAGRLVEHRPGRGTPVAHSATGTVPAMIARAAAMTIGARWTAALHRIAKIESGFRCSPGGNGGGLFQFIGGTRRRLGLTWRSAQSCRANIGAAMRYASACIAKGARTPWQLMACWNSGSPFTSRRALERAYRRSRHDRRPRHSHPAPRLRRAGPVRAVRPVGAAHSLIHLSKRSAS